MLALNGTGILMQGGVHPDLPLSYYTDLLHELRERYPDVHLHAFSPPEVKFIAKKERMSFYDVISTRGSSPSPMPYIIVADVRSWFRCAWRMMSIHSSAEVLV